MSSSQKGLVIICIILLLLSLLDFLSGVLSAIGVDSLVSGYVSDFSIRSWSLAISWGVVGMMIYAVISWLFSVLLGLMIGITGLRGAKNPLKIMPFYVLSIIGLILVVAAIISNEVLGFHAAHAPTNISVLVLIVVSVLLAHNIRRPGSLREGLRSLRLKNN